MKFFAKVKYIEKMQTERTRQSRTSEELFCWFCDKLLLWIYKLKYTDVWKLINSLTNRKKSF